MKIKSFNIIVFIILILNTLIIYAQEIVFVENNEAKGVIYPTSSKEYIKKAATEI